jgi:sec-independent protein translocase protein TatB
MLDIGPSELLLIVIVAVIAIGPKELPTALRTVGRWIAQMRRMSAHFRTGLDAMIREAEMAELEKKWADQNAKIMREHPADAPPEMEPTGAYPARPAPPEPPPAAAEAKVVTPDDPDEYRDMPPPGGKPEA